MIHERPHIYLCRMNGLFTLKVATFDGAFFMSKLTLENINFFLGILQYFFTTRVLTVYRMDILMTIFISIIVQCEDICENMCNFVFHAYTDEHWLVPQKIPFHSLQACGMWWWIRVKLFCPPLTHFPLWTWVCK